ncbi:hypothetical protein JMF89_05510 [Clostridiaceae bacterium UIB06]|nr:hypothetical protein [Clostridiaceae bacterium UIB06]
MDIFTPSGKKALENMVTCELLFHNKLVEYETDGKIIKYTAYDKYADKNKFRHLKENNKSKIN